LRHWRELGEIERTSSAFVRARWRARDGYVHRILVSEGMVKRCRVTGERWEETVVEMQGRRRTCPKEVRSGMT
jgi:hypothetical protein